MIKNLTLSPEGNACSWECCGEHIEKIYTNKITCKKLKDDSGVVVILNIKEEGVPAGYVFSANGSVRHKLALPKEYPNSYDFYDLRYDSTDELRVIVCLKNQDGWSDLACVLDPESGVYKRYFEVR